MTLQRLIKPLLEGTYTMRNRYTGKYLTATDAGLLGTTRHFPEGTKYSQWRIRKTDDFEPRYTLENLQTKTYLTWSGMSSAADDSVFFELDTTGIYWSIAQETSLDSSLSSTFLVENSSTNLVDWGSSYNGSDYDDYLNWMLYWELELLDVYWSLDISDPLGGATQSYEWQWEQASNIPMWKGGSYTWSDMCVEVSEESVCPSGYAGVREYYNSAGMTAERNKLVIEANIGTCDTSIILERQRFQLPGLLQALKDTAGSTCESFDLSTMSTLMKQAIAEDCYSECVTEIELATANISCDGATSESWGEAYTAMRESLSCNLSPSTILYLSDHVMQLKCWTWPVPSALWVSDDQGPGVTNLARADGTAVCAMESGAESSRSDSKIQQTGTCVEGTTCECPSTWLSNHESLAELRETAFEEQYSADGTATANFFIADASEGYKLITSQIQSSLMTGTAAGVFYYGRSLSAAILAAPLGAPFILMVGLSVFSFSSTAFQWTCDKVVGCWPAEPKRVNGACRLPDATKEGGSTVWFMPPPGFYLEHRTWRVQKCALSACSREDLIAERVEFTEREVYNCQFLTYNEMTTDQQSSYIQRLNQTLPSEYSSEI